MNLNQNQIFFKNHIYTWYDLLKKFENKLDQLDKNFNSRVIFAVSNNLDALAVVVGGIIKKLDFGVVSKSRITDDLTDHLCQQGISIYDYDNSVKLSDVTENRVFSHGRINVLTSGTTNIPKLIAHNIESLNTYDKIKTLDPNNWFLSYQIGSYAWYQLVFLSLCVPEQHLVLNNSTDLIEDFEELLLENKITAVSSTPSFWRQFLITVDIEKIHNCLKIISLGGEIVDQSILDQLKNLFPTAIIRHIYASSESGAAIIVSDGLAGFDARLLKDSVDSRISLKIVNGRLHIRSCYGNIDSIDNWIDTGDLVEQQGNRVYFRGRSDNQIINVGGQKVYAAVVEERLLDHPDVHWAQVVAKRTPILGYLPIANIVLKNKIDYLQAEKDLTRFCEEKLPEYSVPRIWNFLDNVPLLDSLKT